LLERQQASIHTRTYVYQAIAIQHHWAALAFPGVDVFLH